jgi:hypothetical protein
MILHFLSEIRLLNSKTLLTNRKLMKTYYDNFYFSFSLIFRLRRWMKDGNDRL